MGNELPKSMLTDQEEKVSKEKLSISSEIDMEYDYEVGAYVYETEQGTRMARIPMIGTLTKYGGLCSYGSRHLTDRIHRANLNKKIDGIVLLADGPGGSVSGTTELGNAVKDSEKPVVAFVDEMAASAHYWVVSQASQVVVNSEEYSEVGSIGVLCMLVSEREWLKKEGLEVQIMRAEQSEDKARLNSVEEWPEESIQELQATLNKMADDFINAVKSGRGDRLNTKDENIFTGRMYSAAEAEELGMIDYHGNLAGAVMLCQDLVNAKTKNSIIV